MGAESRRSGKGWRPTHLIRRLDTLCCDPRRRGPLLQPAASLLRLMIVTFLCGDRQHVRLDGVKCDTAASGFHFSRLRQVPDVTAHLVR